MFTAHFILFGVVLAQLVDALTFTIGVARFGIGLESNGMVVLLHDSAGIAGVLGAKLGTILTAIAVLVYAADRFPRLLVWGGAAGTSIGLLGFAANGLSIAIIG